MVRWRSNTSVDGECKTEILHAEEDLGISLGNIFRTEVMQ